MYSSLVSTPLFGLSSFHVTYHLPDLVYFCIIWQNIKLLEGQDFFFFLFFIFAYILSAWDQALMIILSHWIESCGSSKQNPCPPKTKGEINWVLQCPYPVLHIPSYALWSGSSVISVHQYQQGVFIIKKFEFEHNPHSTLQTHKEPKWQLYGKTVFNLIHFWMWTE